MTKRNALDGERLLGAGLAPARFFSWDCPTDLGETVAGLLRTASARAGYFTVRRLASEPTLDRRVSARLTTMLNQILRLAWFRWRALLGLLLLMFSGAISTQENSTAAATAADDVQTTYEAMPTQKSPTDTAIVVFSDWRNGFEREVNGQSGSMNLFAALPTFEEAVRGSSSLLQADSESRYLGRYWVSFGDLGEEARGLFGDEYGGPQAFLSSARAKPHRPRHHAVVNLPAAILASQQRNSGDATPVAAYLWARGPSYILIGCIVIAALGGIAWVWGLRPVGILQRVLHYGQSEERDERP